MYRCAFHVHMIHSDSEYPYHHNELPSLKQLLQTLDWDVVCVFDACRWDAFNEICDDSEPVRAPGSNTPTWTQQVWCDSDTDWSDVTYISGNPVTTNTRNDESRGGKIEDHVGEYVEAYDRNHEQSAWSDVLSTSTARPLMELATQYEPPIVVHFLQPHTPFIGDVCLRADGTPSEFPNVDLEDPEHAMPLEYYMMEQGLVSPEYVRLAYLKNLEYVWEQTRVLRKRFERVITTADHGEKLGPDTWSHGGPRSPQARVVPFHTNTEFIHDMPPASEFGAAHDHEWVHY